MHIKKRKLTTSNPSLMEITVGITGASSAIYAHRTLIHLAASSSVERSQRKNSLEA